MRFLHLVSFLLVSSCLIVESSHAQERRSVWYVHDFYEQYAERTGKDLMPERRVLFEDLNEAAREFSSACREIHEHRARSWRYRFFNKDVKRDLYRAHEELFVCLQSETVPKLIEQMTDEEIMILDAVFAMPRTFACPLEGPTSRELDHEIYELVHHRALQAQDKGRPLALSLYLEELQRIVEDLEGVRELNR